VGAVGLESDIHLFSDGRLGIGGYSVVRDGGRERVVSAVVDGRLGYCGLSYRNCIVVHALVIDCCYGFRRDAVEKVASSYEGALTKRGSHPNYVRRLSYSFDDDIGSLTNTKRHHIYFTGNDRNEVISDNGHDLVVDAELLHTLGTRVDQADAIGLTRLELESGYTSIRRASDFINLAGVIHLSVDQVVVAHRRLSALGFYGHDVFNDVIVIGVILIRKHDRPEIFIVLSIVMWSVDDHRTEETASSLSTIVGVVPGCAVQICTESVCEGKA
jgi:hypothetical protein